jgi:predicted P-loop ATPase
VHVLPPELTRNAIVFPDVTGKGKPAGTRHNAMLAIEGLGIDCREDTFHEAFIVGGQSLGRLVGEISDKAIHQLRDLIRRVFGFEPGAQNTRDAAETLCVQHPFDPVLDYLDGLRWDGVRRIDAWMADYLGAPRDEWSAAVGRLMLVAAVRRVRVPGAKWDHIVVLEGPQGIGKGLVLQTLAGDENFSNMRVLGRTEERQHEALRGVWIFEIAELAGMRRTDIEHIKAFITRHKESTRTAYAHYKTHDYRRCIFVATTNESHYLKDDTGNRRFLPVRTERIDWAGVARDRDQLWAEAVAAEKSYGMLVLPDAVLEKAREEQEERVPFDPWQEAIERWVKNKIDTSVYDVLDLGLRLNNQAIDQLAKNRAARALLRLGFVPYRARHGAKREYRYRRLEYSDQADQVEDTPT